MKFLKKKKILAIIPARGGSKSLKNKNIIDLLGKPLISYSINCALNSKYISRIIVSTDSKKIKRIANKYGAEVPFMRPRKYATDKSKDYEVVKHTLDWLKKNEKYNPDLVVQLRPTYPLRNINFIDKQILKALKIKNFDAMKSVIEFGHTPFKMWFKQKKEMLPIIGNLKDEFFNYPRQMLKKKIYLQNACIDIINPKSLIKNKSISGNKILPIIMSKDENFDIDYASDLKKVKEFLKGNKAFSRFI
jgi:CMP-N-acetylneuraminic acid synthetase